MANTGRKARLCENVRLRIARDIKGWRRWRLYLGFAGVISGLRVYWTQCHSRRWTPGLLRAIRRLNNRYCVHSILHVMIARNKRAVRAGSELESPHSGPGNAEMALGSPSLVNVFARLGLPPLLTETTVGDAAACHCVTSFSGSSWRLAGGFTAAAAGQSPTVRTKCREPAERRG